jgi:hypothetical protein
MNKGTYNVNECYSQYNYTSLDRTDVNWQHSQLFIFRYGHSSICTVTQGTHSYLCIMVLKCNFFSLRETVVAQWRSRGRQFPEGENLL